MARPKVVLPEQGVPKDEIIKLMEDLIKGDINWREGKVWSLVYHASDEHSEFLKKAYTMFFSKNALSPMAFPSLKKFEAEVVAMTASLLGGDDGTAGNMTSGDLHFLELRHVMPRLAADEQRLVAAYAAAADRLNDDEPEVSGAVTRILARHREHLDALQTVAGAGAPS